MKNDDHRIETTALDDTVRTARGALIPAAGVARREGAPVHGLETDSPMTSELPYVPLRPEGGVPVKAWIRGVPLEDSAREQVFNVARLPFVGPWVAVMPDVHWGMGATVGSVIPTRGAIVPAAVGVDIGCGMIAVRTSLKASALPEDLRGVRSAIEKAVPHGRTNDGGPGDRGAWSNPPPAVEEAWKRLEPRFEKIVERHPKLGRG